PRLRRPQDALSSWAPPASTASQPYVRDDRETPLCVGRDGRISQVICVRNQLHRPATNWHDGQNRRPACWRQKQRIAPSRNRKGSCPRSVGETKNKTFRW